MRTRITVILESLSESFWFLPALMVATALVLGMITTRIDQTYSGVIMTIPWLYAGSPDGARSVLSTVAGSMISVAGLTFSITLATLSLASSQLGPRLLTNFMRDRGNQIVLGTFVSVFAYCLIVLRAIRSADEMAFVPHLSVILATVVTILSLGVLIYFFHHVATIIQAQNVIASISRELEHGIARLVDEDTSRHPYRYNLKNDEDIPADFDERGAKVSAHGSGYFQAVDYGEMQRIASEHGLLLRVLYRPGDFIAKGSPLIAAYPADPLTDEVSKALHSTVVLGTRRLRFQDIDFAVDQLVEIALRALSPGINDPFTAIGCLDHLGTALADLAGYTIPTGYYYDPDGSLRLIREALTFEGTVDSAFNQIRQAGASNVAVLIRMLEVLTIISTRAKTQHDRQALMRHADMIMRAADRNVHEENDLADIARRYDMMAHAASDQPA